MTQKIKTTSNELLCNIMKVIHVNHDTHKFQTHGLFMGRPWVTQGHLSCEILMYNTSQK